MSEQGNRRQCLVMRSKVVQPNVVCRFSLEEYIPDDHLLRLVDSVLDLSFVRGLGAKLLLRRGSAVGRPGRHLQSVVTTPEVPTVTTGLMTRTKIAFGRP